MMANCSVMHQKVNIQKIMNLKKGVGIDHCNKK